MMSCLPRPIALAIRNREIEKIVAEELKKQNITDATAPSDLADQVREYLTIHPQARWDEAVNEIAGDTDVPEQDQ